MRRRRSGRRWRWSGCWRSPELVEHLVDDLDELGCERRRGQRHVVRVSEMRVLFAITRGEVGGAQQHLRVLAEGLLARGVSVTAAVEEGSALEHQLAHAGVEVVQWHSIRRNPNPIKDIRSRRELRSIVDDQDPHVLALYSSKAGALGRGLTKGRQGVTILTCHHAPYGPGRQWSHRLLTRPIDQLTLPLVDGIISDGARDVPMLRRLAPEVPVRVIPNAFEFRDPPPDPSESRGPVVLWVARLRRPKDPLQLIEAWPTVVRRHPGARLVMCGTGPLEDAVRRAIARSRVGSSIDFVGFVHDLSPLLATASVFVLASDVEGGITMATLEAMGAGIVPVVSDVGDAFLLEHARAGVVVPRRSPQALGAAVAALLADDEALVETRRRAISTARSTWSSEGFVDATLAFYLEVLGRPPAR